MVSCKERLEKSMKRIGYCIGHETASGTIAPTNELADGVERGGRIRDQANGGASGMPVAVGVARATVPFT